MTKKFDGVPIRRLPDDESYSSDAITTTQSRCAYNPRAGYRRREEPYAYVKKNGKTKLGEWPHQRGVKQKRNARGRFTT